ncbi:MAG: type II secretion system protein [Rhizobacter sp.]
MASRNKSNGSEQGFTYLGLLLMIAVIGIGLSAASEVWVTSAHRQKMDELEWVGAQFTQALASYYEASPGSVKVFPAAVGELLEDRRYLTVRRHLRSVYLNPFTGKTDWMWLTGPDGRLRGIRVNVPTDEGGAVREFVQVPR